MSAPREEDRLLDHKYDDIQATGGPENLQDKQMVALVAYLQRLGTDIKKAGSTAQRSPLLGGL